MELNKKPTPINLNSVNLNLPVILSIGQSAELHQLASGYDLDQIKVSYNADFVDIKKSVDDIPPERTPCGLVDTGSTWKTVEIIPLKKGRTTVTIDNGAYNNPVKTIELWIE